jgi:tetratricopeptide (TPR) repeat protein
VIDEELLQELLAKASSLYNNGDYQGAIEVWNEILQSDPSNIKAQEGIQMSHLLIGDLDPGLEAGGGQQPADGGEPANVALTPQEVEARLGEGVARVKSLMAERKFPEALEGARSLVPIDPGSEEVQKLIEEAQQSFESAPFIEEHLTLARELMAQERHDEAEAECRKVFALDRSNPDAADLLRQMQRPVPPEAETPASTETGHPPAFAGGAEAQYAPAAAGGADDLELIDIPDTSAPIAEDDSPGRDEGGEQEIIEAKEVVPPAVRMVPASDEDEAAKQRLLEDPSLAEPPSATAGEEIPAPAESPGGQKDPAEWENELAQLNLKEEEADLLGESPATQDAAPADPAADTGADADLMSLLDEEFATTEGAIVSDGEPAGATNAIPLSPPDESQDEPVMEEGGPPSATSGIPVAPPLSETASAPSPAQPLEEPVEEMPAEPVGEPEPEPEPESALIRRVPAAPGQSEGRSSIPKYFALLGVVILLAGGAAWWFLFRPSPAGAKGDPGGTAAPPAGASSSPPAGADAGPIPTPIGGPSRKPIQQPAGDGAAAAAAPLVEVVTEPPPDVDAKATMALSPQEVEQRIEGHLSRGRRLLAREDWQGARKEMRAAMALDPFNLQVRTLSDRADAKIEEQEELLREFGEVRRMFDAKDYQGTLWKLYRIRRDPALGNVERYIRNSWYNWAAVSMRAGNNGDALEKIGEALATDPKDAEARKLQGFAERYAARAKDDVYYAFADTIELRSIDQN